MLTEHRDRSYSIAGLALAATELLACFRVKVRDDRVTAGLDERTLRYLQTLGLLDRPARYEGRSAVYTYRHLLQALAVRALQAAGLSLAQAQGALSGATTEALESAVLDALGATDSAPQMSTAVRTAGTLPARPVPWLVMELAPGVVLSIDPARVADPTALIHQLSRAMPHPLPSPTDEPPALRSPS